MVTVPNKMVGLERMSDYRGVGSVSLHCMFNFDSSHQVCVVACTVYPLVCAMYAQQLSPPGCMWSMYYSGLWIQTHDIKIAWWHLLYS